MASLPAAAAGNVRTSEWWMTTLGIRNAWPVSRGQGVTVAVLSDGVDYLQPDLTGGVVTNGPDFTGTGQSSGQFFGEVGTGVAALIAGHGYGLDAQQGLLGVVPLAHILSVRVTLPPNDPMLANATIAAGLPNAIASGIRYAVGHGATVIDLPLDPGQAGAAGTGAARAAAGGSAAEASAVKYALSHNVVLVAPAGDDNLAADAPNFPAAYPGVIAVGAFSQNFVKAPWSSHQGYVTVTAAGSGVTVPTNTGSFQTAGSTTYASAMVAGVAAMIQSRFPGMSAADVRKALIAGTVFHGTGRSNGSGYGTVNAQSALTAAAALSPSIPAGAGAAPLSAPAAPAPQSPRSGFVHSIIRAALISAGLLVLLLLIVAVYASTGRRRSSRRQDAVAAGWSRNGQSRYPRGGVTDGDRMLEFFAAPASDPAVVMERSAAPSGPGRLAPADGPRADADAGAGLLAGPGTDPFGGRSAPPPSWEAVETAARSNLSPASRAVSKRPTVSGTPPWDDALRPHSELPWTSTSEAGTGTGPGAGAEVAADAGEAVAYDLTAGGARVTRENGSAARPTEAGSRPDSGIAAAIAARRAVSGRHSARTGAEPAAAAFGQPAAPIRWDSQAEEVTGADSGPEPGSEPFSYRSGSHGSGPRQVFPAPDARSQDLPPAGLDLPRRRLAEPAAASTDEAWPGLSAPSRPAQSLTGRLDWTQGPTAQSVSPPGAEEEFPQLQVPGGPLPVRQPRHSTPPAAPSPSGSLWERAAPSPETPAGSPDSGSRPIFVWNPTAEPENPELAATEATWSLRSRDQGPAE